MKKILKILTLSLLFSNLAFATTKEGKREKYAQTYKKLIGDKKQRIFFWKEKAINKFK